MTDRWDIDATEQEGTARFQTVVREGGPEGRIALRAGEWGSIVDFATRRALVRLQVAPPFRGRKPPMTVYQFCEGSFYAAATSGTEWIVTRRDAAVGPLREPYPLRFLDFLRADAVKEQRLLGEADARGVPTQHFALTLELDPAHWPRPSSALETRAPHLLRVMMAKLTLIDLEPYGRLPMEAWVDAEARIRRVGWTTRRAQRNLNAVPWTTTELWDFGGPPPIADRESQSVIDPVTMEPISQS
jgi:hypothetical protein